MTNFSIFVGNFCPPGYGSTDLIGFGSGSETLHFGSQIQHNHQEPWHWQTRQMPHWIRVQAFNIFVLCICRQVKWFPWNTSVNNIIYLMQSYLLLYLAEKQQKINISLNLLIAKKCVGRNKFYWTNRPFIANILLSWWLQFLSQSGWYNGHWTVSCLFFWRSFPTLADGLYTVNQSPLRPLLMVDTAPVGNWYPCPLPWWLTATVHFCWCLALPTSLLLWLLVAAVRFFEGGIIIFSQGDWVAAVCWRWQPLSFFLVAGGHCFCLWLASMSSLMVADGYRYPDGNLYPNLLTWWLMDIAIPWWWFVSLSSHMVADGYRYPDGNLYPCCWWLQSASVMAAPVFSSDGWRAMLH